MGERAPEQGYERQVRWQSLGARRADACFRSRLSPPASTLATMSAQPDGSPDPAEPYDVIHLGGETAVVVPVAEYRRLRALEQLASAEELERAGAAAATESYREWIAAGRPPGIPHAEARRMLLGGT